VAAQLATDRTLDVRRQRGGLGELRVVVDGTDVVDTKRLWYPTPSSVTARVRAFLEGRRDPT
jgi:hypothetical protein